MDKDPQAVETTKLALLLKILEGESADTLERQLDLLKVRALPDLQNNIQCGNSLIEPDYFDGPMSNVGDAEIRQVNAFNWFDAFFRRLRSTGFDVVIGNPPYIFTRELISGPERAYYARKFTASFDKHNTFMLFIELMSRLLVKNGKGSYIVPNSWLTMDSAKLLRSHLVPRLEFITDLNYEVFNKVGMEPCIFGIGGKNSTSEVQAVRVSSKRELASARPISLDRRRFDNRTNRIVFSSASKAYDLLERVLKRSSRVGSEFDVRSGLQAYERGKGTPPQRADQVEKHIFDRSEKDDDSSIRYLEGADVKRYAITWSGMWLQYGPWLAQPRSLQIFTRPRVLIREITSHFPYCIEAMLAEALFLNNKSILNVLDFQDNVVNLKVLLATINSRFTALFYKERAVKSARKLFPKILARNLAEFPFPGSIKPGLRQQIVHLVEAMISYQLQLANHDSSKRPITLLRRIDAVERQINLSVYKIFDLTDDEVGYIERIDND
ncbi:MAG: Eco57I restriction-modification methylase domain-containing protein [Candidatus Eremiobacter antarcticus]